jgi:hypothetical protein
VTISGSTATSRQKTGSVKFLLPCSFTLELTESQPEFALEPERELALIAEMVDRRKFVDAVSAYERFYEFCRKDPEMHSRPFAVNALIFCGDVLMEHLDQPKEAFLSYRKALQSEFKLTDIQKKRIIEKA